MNTRIHRRTRITRITRFLTIVGTVISINTSYAAPLPASAEIYTISQGVAVVKTEQAAQITISDKETPGLSVQFPSDSKYPAVNFQSSDGSWDMSKYNAIEAVVVNTGTAQLRLGLRIDNPGNWQDEPWSSGNLSVAPGETANFIVHFGHKYGAPSYQLDASKIINVKLMALNPKPGSQLLLTSIKAINAAETTGATIKAPTQTSVSSSASALQLGGMTLFDPATADINAVQAEQDETELSQVNGTDGVAAMNIRFATNTKYPGINFIPVGQTLNLASYGGVEAKLHNAGTEKIKISLRIDNAGHWKDEPWNVSSTTINPGETKDLRVTFGMNNDMPAFPLDPTSIIQIKLFSQQPSTPSMLQLISLTGVAKSAGGATSSTNFNVPPIEGDFYKINADSDLSRLTQNSTSVSIDQSTGTAALKVHYDSDVMYPNVTFPCPDDGGWNMETFGGIQVDVTNLSDHTLSRVVMRVDNPSTATNKTPWNTEKISIDPGETKTLSLVFGGTESKPQYPLDPTQITGIQVFQEKPKQDSTLLLQNLRAYGSPKTGPVASWSTSMADRDIPVTPPEWLGTRPPVAGDWVATLDQNFDEDTLNQDIWTRRLSYDGVQPAEIARNIEENVYIEDGAMVIKAEINPGHHHNDPKLPTREYASGAATTYDKWTQCYGYIEARVKLPTARGLWPAFWTMPDRGEASGLDKWTRRATSAKNGIGQGMEMDILEYLTEWGRGRNNVAVHWDGYGEDHKSWGSSYIYYGPTPDDWHTFGLLWEPGKLTWYIDGKVTCVWENERVIDVPVT